jgi:hypothetical protein
MVLAAGASAYLALRINISVSDDPALYLYSGGAKETAISLQPGELDDAS